jgi:hypothetical protein
MSNGLTYQQLHWEVTPTRFTSGGIEHPALSALGLGRSLHILRALTGPDEARESWEDKRYYVSTR